MVPFRAIFEALGAKVTWDGEHNSVTATKGDIAMNLTAKNKIAMVNNSPTNMDAPPKIIHGRMYVPLRFVGESLGCKVTWEPSLHMVIIEDPKQPVQISNYRRLFVLTDNDIKKIIAAKKDFNLFNNEILLQRTKAHRTLGTNQPGGIDYLPAACMLTPYYRITLNAASAKKYYESYAVEDVRKDPDMKLLSFVVWAYGMNIDFPKSCRAVLTQGTDSIKPLKIYGTELLAKPSESWPREPEYISFFEVYFLPELINLDKPAEFVFVDSFKETRFSVDFSKFK